MKIQKYMEQRERDECAAFSLKLEYMCQDKLEPVEALAVREHRQEGLRDGEKVNADGI